MEGGELLVIFIFIRIIFVLIIFSLIIYIRGRVGWWVRFGVSFVVDLLCVIFLFGVLICFFTKWE